MFCLSLLYSIQLSGSPAPVCLKKEAIPISDIKITSFFPRALYLNIIVTQ